MKKNTYLDLFATLLIVVGVPLDLRYGSTIGFWMVISGIILSIVLFVRKRKAKKSKINSHDN